MLNDLRQHKYFASFGPIYILKKYVFFPSAYMFLFFKAREELRAFFLNTKIKLRLKCGRHFDDLFITWKVDEKIDP